MSISKTIKKIPKIFISIFVFSIFILSLLATNNLLAAGSWYYTMDNSNGTGKIEVTDSTWTSETICLNALKNVHPSNNPSTGCFLAGNVQITSFAPTEGKFGDLVTINGNNFIDVQSVLFNGASASFVTDSSTKIRVLGVPAAATTGSIAVKTKIHSETISGASFKISSTPADMKWWYKDIADNNVKGPYTKDSCPIERASFQASFITRELGPCFENTVANVEKDKLDSKKTSIPLATETKYKLLAPLPGITNFDSKYDKDTNPCPLGKYLNIIIKLFIGVCAVLAMIMIIYGGFQYMTSVLPSEKQGGKQEITQAIFGLLIALCAYLLLYTINPNLLNFCSVGKTTVPATAQPANP